MKEMARLDKYILEGLCVESSYNTLTHIHIVLLKVATGSARSLITKFDVKKRSYYGNTSMEAEISLLMANQTLVSIVS